MLYCKGDYRRRYTDGKKSNSQNHPGKRREYPNREGWDLCPCQHSRKSAAEESRDTDQIVNNNVPGGARDTFDPEHFQEYWNEKVSENDITKVPDLDNHHSKKAKGKLYK